MEKLKKEHFNAGSPYSEWLKEEMCGEISATIHGMDNLGLVDKLNVKIDNETTDYIMTCISKFDDYPPDLKKLAIEIIKLKLDENFEAP